MMLSKNKTVKVGVALAAAVAFSGVGVEAYIGQSAVNGAGSYAVAGAQKGVAAVAWTADGALGWVPYGRATRGKISSGASWTYGKAANGLSAGGAWFSHYINLPASYSKTPPTKFEVVRDRVAGVLAPVRNGLSKAGSLVTDNKIAKAMHNAFDASLEQVGRHEVGLKRAGVVIAAGAAVYGVYFLIGEMQDAERSIALGDLEARLSAGDLQDATLATLVETRGIKTKEYAAAQKRTLRRQRAEHRDYSTREESDLISRLDGELAEIDEALVVAYQADAGYWTRALNIVSHAVAGE